MAFAAAAGRAPLRRSLSLLRGSLRTSVQASPHPWQQNDGQRRWTSQHRVVLLPEIPSDTAKTNPLLCPPSEGLPNLENISQRQCYNGLGKALLEFESAVCNVEEKCRAGETDFDTLFVPLEEAKCRLESVWNSVNLLSVVTDQLDRDRHVQLNRRAERAFLTRHGSKDIYETLRKIKAMHEEKGHLHPHQLRILDRYLTEYKHQGYGLPAKKQEELNQTWMPKINEAARDFNWRHAQSTQRFMSTIKDPNIVVDFPVDVLKAMAVDSSQPSKGPWTVTLHPYIYRKFLEYCPARLQRWNAHRAAVARGSRAYDEHYYLHVTTQVKALRVHRQDRASVLGYQSFAELSMDTKMAGNTENVHTMIASLLTRARDAQERELDDLQAYAESRGFDERLAAYDVPYYKRKQRGSALGLSDEDLREFFPLPKVVTGVFRLIQNLFGIVIEEVKHDSGTTAKKGKGKQDSASVPAFHAWHPTVKLFKVSDANSGELMGHFFFDPYIRDDKSYSGGDRGWYIPIRPRSEKANCKPLGALVMALPQPGYGKPSLLNFFEVKELLRNVGSLLMHQLGDGSAWSDLSGKAGLEWDALDVAPQFMAQWAHAPALLTALAAHWSSNEPLAPRVVDGLAASRQHLAGYELCGELYKAAYDLAFHSEDLENESFHEIALRLHDEYFVFPQDKDDSFPFHFEEILGGHMPAAYFCKTWSQMLAADAFAAVQEVGLDNAEEVRKVCRRFRSTFLSLGSSAPSADIFRQFRGRDPSHEPLLLNLGLKDISKPKRKGNQSVAQEETN